MIAAAYLEAFTARLALSSTADVAALLALIAAELVSRDPDAANYAMKATNVLLEHPASRYSERGE